MCSQSDHTYTRLLKTSCWLFSMFKLQFTEDRLLIELLTSHRRPLTVLFHAGHANKNNWGNIPQSQVFRRKRNILSQCSTTVFRAKPELTLLLTLSFLMKGSRTYRNFSVQFSLYSTNLLQQSPQDALYCKD